MPHQIRRYIHLVAACFTLLTSSGLLAQTGTLSGRVVDEANPSRGIQFVDIDLLDPTTGEIPVSYFDQTDINGYYEINDIPTGQYKVLFNAVGDSDNFTDELYDDIACDNGSCDRANLGTAIIINSGANTLYEALTAVDPSPLTSQLTESEIAVITLILNSAPLTQGLPGFVSELQLTGLPDPSSVARIVTDDGVEIILGLESVRFSANGISGEAFFGAYGLPVTIISDDGTRLSFEWRTDGTASFELVEPNGNIIIGEVSHDFDLTQVGTARASSGSLGAQSQSRDAQVVKWITVNVAACENDVPISDLSPGSLTLEWNCESPNASGCFFEEAVDSVDDTVSNIQWRFEPNPRFLDEEPVPGQYNFAFGTPTPEACVASYWEDSRQNLGTICTIATYADITNNIADQGGPSNQQFAYVTALAAGESAAQFGSDVAEEVADVTAIGADFVGNLTSLATASATAGIGLVCGLENVCSLYERGSAWRYNLATDGVKNWVADVRITDDLSARRSIEAAFDASPLTFNLDVGGEFGLTRFAVSENYVLDYGTFQPRYDIEYDAQIKTLCGAGWSGQLDYTNSEGDVFGYGVNPSITTAEDDLLRVVPTTRKRSQDVWELTLTPPANSNRQPVSRRFEVNFEIPTPLSLSTEGRGILVVSKGERPDLTFGECGAVGYDALQDRGDGDCVEPLIWGEGPVFVEAVDAASPADPELPYELISWGGACADTPPGETLCRIDRMTDQTQVVTATFSEVDPDTLIRDHLIGTWDVYHDGAYRVGGPYENNTYGTCPYKVPGVTFSNYFYPEEILVNLNVSTHPEHRITLNADGTGTFRFYNFDSSVPDAIANCVLVLDEDEQNIGWSVSNGVVNWASRRGHLTIERIQVKGPSGSYMNIDDWDFATGSRDVTDRYRLQRLSN